MLMRSCLLVTVTIENVLVRMRTYRTCLYSVRNKYDKICKVSYSVPEWAELKPGRNHH